MTCWERWGRESAETMCSQGRSSNAAGAARCFLAGAEHHGTWLREDYATEIEAVRWTAVRLVEPTAVRLHLDPESIADQCVSEALQMLLLGFRARLREMAEG